MRYVEILCANLHETTINDEFNSLYCHAGLGQQVKQTVLNPKR